MSGNGLIQNDLDRIRGELRAAIGDRYPEFEQRIQALLLEFDRDPAKIAVWKVQGLIMEYLAPDVAWRILEDTLILRRGGFSFQPQPGTGAIDTIELRVAGRNAVSGSQYIPFGAEAPTTYVTVPVWFATDRDHRLGAPPPKRFGTDLSIVDDQTVMNYGTVDVSIPKTHETGKLEAPKRYFFEWKADPARHIVVQRVTELDERSWIRSIRERVAEPPDRDDDSRFAPTDTSRDILIFIHGYRTTWQESARRAAQFAYDLQFEGLPMLYSWPSRGDLLSYTADETASAWSAPHFTAVLKTVLAESGARRVHLVAHSMGNRLSTEALRTLALEKADYPTPVREVVFAAPDIDRHTFREFVTAFNAAVADFEAPRMPRLTLYACGVDSALDLSRRVHRLNRAGDSRKGIVVALPMDTIEVARRVIREESHDSIGHSYFCSNSVVIADLVGVVLNGQAPMERAGLAPKSTRGGPYWRLVGDGTAGWPWSQSRSRTPAR